jgi:hypothetical protein
MNSRGVLTDRDIGGCVEARILDTRTLQGASHQNRVLVLASHNRSPI